MRLLARTAAVVLCLLAAGARAAVAQDGEAEALAREMAVRVNAERARAGLPELRWDARLAVAAEASARALATGEARTGGLDDFGVRLGRVGYVFQDVAELQAWGPLTASDAIGLILSDQDKRRKLLARSLEDLGVGFARRPASLQLAQRYETYWSILIAQTVPPLPPLAESRAAMIAAINAHRARHRLPPLRADARLHTVAQRHSADMAARRRMDHSGHDGSDVGTRVERGSYSYGYAAENVAANPYTAERTVADWIASQGHNRNMLHPEIEEAGVGVVEAFDTDATVVRYWTLVLARQLRLAPLLPGRTTP